MVLKYTGIICLLLLLIFFPITLVYPSNPGEIRGQITIKSFRENAIGFVVEAVDNSENIIASTVTDIHGNYELSGITVTQVFVRVPEQFGYAKIFYDGFSLINTATPITIIPNGFVENIDIELEEVLIPPDNDSDTIRDAEEVIYGNDGFRTNPNSADTDSDGLSDTEETTAGLDGFFTNPLVADTDNDTLSDNLDPVPASTYISIHVTHGVLPNESTTVIAELRDLYHNLINKNGITFSLHCNGSAVFANSANTGTLVSGGGTQTVIVQTISGIVSMGISSAIIEDVTITASDSASLGLLTFSLSTPYHSIQIPITEMGGSIIESPVRFVDDFARNIPLGISFKFFGMDYTHADIHSNGFLTFDIFEGIPTEPFFQQMYTNDPIPDSTIPNNFIAPYWDDLNIESHDTGKILYVTQQTHAGTIFRVRWQDHGIYDSREPINATLTFDAILYEQSNLILLSYKKLINGTSHTADGSSATIGLENRTGTNGIQFSYNTSSLTKGLSILLSTAPDPIAYFLPLAGDFDNDGLTNAQERTVSFTDPVNPDTDGDGLPDKWEYDYGLDPNSASGINGSSGDFDNDGLNNADELYHTTIPNDNDSDNDGLTDGDEIFIYHTLPTESDTDNDTLSDGEEIYFANDGFRTNPLDNDSDSDGINDSIDQIPVFARLVIIEPADASIGNPDPEPVKFQLWSLDGDLLTPVNNFIFEAQVTGSAFFLPTAIKGTILSGANTNTVTVQVENGEAYLVVRDFTAQKVFFHANDPNSSNVRFPMQTAGFQSIPSKFIDIADPSNLLSLNGDDESVTVNLPTGFFFSFFNILYSQINPLLISSNGYITFSTIGTAVTNRPIPFHASNDPDAYIAPFWDDLKISNGTVYQKVIGTASSRRFIIQWDTVSLASTPSITLRFQLVLYEKDSLIEFYYDKINNNGLSATIGIENDTGTAGIEVGFNSGILTSFSGYALFDGSIPSMQFINGDHDGDGLSDLDEINTYGTDPAIRDTDNDGLEDDDEVLVYNTNPTNADTDNDGLTDMEEIFDYGTNPFNTNSDNDSFSDSQEVTAGTNPNDPTSYLHIIQIYQNETTHGVVIRWSSVAGKTYHILAKSGSLGTNFIVLENNFQASASESSYYDEGNDNNAIPNPKFEFTRLYKISVVK